MDGEECEVGAEAGAAENSVNREPKSDNRELRTENYKIALTLEIYSGILVPEYQIRSLRCQMF